LKKQELKDIIRPMVEEAVKDVLLKGGLLSAIISEVVSGVQSGQQLVESKSQPPQNQNEPEQAQLQAQEQRRAQDAASRKKLLDAIGTSGYNGVNVFEGTEPLKKGGSPSKSSGGYSPFEGVDPRDPGVDISALTSMVGNAWKKLS
tara:strand:- start:166 stop:603 length:438 start_codon:yes stop_codon:yes gene_type:complete